MDASRPSAPASRPSAPQARMSEMLTSIDWRSVVSSLLHGAAFGGGGALAAWGVDEARAKWGSKMPVVSPADSPQTTEKEDAE